MKKREVVPQHLADKRNEMIWSLSTQQDYTDAQIAIMFNLHRSSVGDIVKKIPDNWRSPWKKTY